VNVGFMARKAFKATNRHPNQNYTYDFIGYLLDATNHQKV